jgi:hypothetical protein
LVFCAAIIGVGSRVHWYLDMRIFTYSSTISRFILSVNTMSQSEYLAQYSSGCFDASYTEFYVPNNTVNIPTSCGANVV